MHLKKLRPTHSPLTPLGGRIDMMTPKDVTNGNLINVMSQIRQGTLEAAVPPGRVVVGHVQDKRFDFIRDTGPASFVTFLAAVKLLSDKPFVPSHQGIWRGERGQRFETFAAKWEGEGSETAAFSIGEANASITEFGVKGAVFFLEVGNDLLLVPIDPAGDHGDKDWQNHGDS
jgi:hypothetical protein